MVKTMFENYTNVVTTVQTSIIIDFKLDVALLRHNMRQLSMVHLGATSPNLLLRSSRTPIYIRDTLTRINHTHTVHRKD